MTRGMWAILICLLAAPDAAQTRLLFWVWLKDDATLSSSAHPEQEPKVDCLVAFLAINKPRWGLPFSVGGEGDGAQESSHRSGKQGGGGVCNRAGRSCCLK